jgi:hypothetical protein
MHAEKEAAEVPFIFFFFGQGLGLYVSFYNIFNLGVSMGWLSVFFPLNSFW